MRSIRFTKFSRVSSFSWACASWAWAALACAGFVASGCKRPPSEPEKSEGPLVLASRGSEGDSPVFTLASATQGVEGSGPLTATIETTKGTLTCTLFEDKAPVTVANFVGLARGTRKWKQGRGGPWVTRPFYDGLKFHRVIPGFVIQGGDQNGDGSGDAGYEFIDEVWPGAKHDRAGLMCMANHGPNTNSSQFFITDGVTPHLDGGYSIFGECKQIDVVHAIATVPSQRERPTDHVTMTKVTIARASR